MSVPHLTHISDTARWVAVLRAREGFRKDALFHDHLALGLAGYEGGAIADVMKLRAGMPDWPIVMRTVILDEHVLRCVADGVDMVIDLAAGLDVRPYRLKLPKELIWVDVDLPNLTAEKNAALANEVPTCRVERHAVDLSDAAARRALFAQLGARCKKALVITEGLLVYLTEAQVSGIATDLAAVPTFHYWTMELASKALLQWLNKRVGKHLAEAGMPMQWGTADGPHFFERFGWRVLEARSVHMEAAKYKRLPWFFQLLSHLPQPKPPWKRVWSGVCLFEK